MKKNELFDIVLEEYHSDLNFVHQKMTEFLINIFTENKSGISN